MKRGSFGEDVGPCRGTEDGKGTGIISGKSGTGNLEAASVRNRTSVQEGV